jgi:hypothetical protein
MEDKLDCPYDVEKHGWNGTCECGGESYEYCLSEI